MAKKKKREQVVVGDGTEVKPKNRDSGILDTTPGPMILDTNMSIEAMLNTQRVEDNNTNVTFSMKKWQVNILKKIALEESIRTDKTVLYTDLIKRAIAEIHFKE